LLGTLGPSLEERKKTVGVIDIGGQSAQITFLTFPDVAIRKHKKTIKLGKLKYNLYIKSHNNYGQQAALNRILKQIIEENPSSNEVKFPCFLRGYSSNFTFEDVKNFSQNRLVVGTGNPRECIDLIHDHFNQAVPCKIPPCSINGSYQATVSPTTHFYTISSAVYVNEFFSRPFRYDQLISNKLKNFISKFCQKNWKDVLAELSNSEPTKYLSNYCFVGLYVIELMTKGLLLNENEIIHAQKQYNNFDLFWIFGYLISFLSERPRSLSCHSFSNSSRSPNF